MKANEGKLEYGGLILPIKRACWVFGCWPSGSSRGRQALAVVSMLVLAAGSTLEAIKHWGKDMNETIECSLVCSAIYMCVLRVLVFIARQDDFRFVLREMENDWARSSEHERKILRKKCLHTFKFAKFFVTNVMITGCAFVLMPLAEMLTSGDELDRSTRTLPFRGYYFFDHTTSPRYQITYALNSFLGFMGCSTIAGGTSFSLVTTMHAAAKFHIVQNDFETINDWQSKSKVGKVIRKHQECIMYAEAVERVINFLALGQFVVSTGLLCFAGFQLTTMLEDRARLTKYTTFINSAIMELLIFSHSGHNLKTESENVADFVYSSNWIGYPSPSSIKLAMMRARKPCTITAGKFYDVSYDSFLKVISSSFSYFTVLLAMQDKET